jgi:hypothetical protein
MRKRKLTDEQVKEVQALAKTSIKKVEIARRYGISPQSVSSIARFGYEPRPPRFRGKMPTDEANTWENIARQYNARNPEDQITGERAKRIFENSLAKMRRYFASRNLTLSDLL